MIGSLYAPHPGGEFLRTGKPSHNSKRTNPSEHSHINYKNETYYEKDLVNHRMFDDGSGNLFPSFCS